MAMTGAARPLPSPLAWEWRCHRCRRYLAQVEGDVFTRPNGDSGRLPAVIRCKCGARNARALDAATS